MSSTTGSRHNWAQGQGLQPTTTTKPQGGAGERHYHRPHPTGGGRGGYHGVGGGRGGVAALHHNARVAREGHGEKCTKDARRTGPSLAQLPATTV